MGRILEMLRRRRWLIVSLLFIGLIPALTMPFVLPPLFQATSTVEMQKTPDVMKIGADFMPEQTGDSRKPLKSIMAIVLSDRVLGRVADQMPEEGDAPKGIRRKVLEGLGVAQAKTTPSPALLRQARIEMIRGSLRLTDTGGGRVLEISAVSGERSTAAFMANAVADAYVSYEMDRRHNASRAAISWLSQKASELRDQIRRQEEAMARLRPKVSQVSSSAPAASSGIKRQLSDKLSQARLALLETEHRMAQLEPGVKAMRGSRATQDVTELRDRYNSVNQALATARLQYTETHPEVLRLEEIVADLRRQLGPARRRSDDPMAMDHLREFQVLESQKARLEAQISALDESLNQVADLGTEHAEALAEFERLERAAGIDRQMLEVLMQRTNETLLRSANDAPTATILDTAVLPMVPFSPDRPKVLLVGLALAFAVAFGAGIAREMFDSRIYNATDAALALGVPFLGSIPSVSDGSQAERQSALTHSTVVGEAYRNLRTSLLFSSGTNKIRSLMVTSAVAGEGKTTVITNLAQSFAMAGRKVVLIDADMRRPRLDRVLALERSPGLSEVLQGEAELADVVRRPVGFEVDVIPAGEIPGNPSELLGGERFDELLAQLTKEYDTVLVDAPVMLAVADSMLLAARVEGVLMLHKPGSVDKRAFAKISEDLKRVDANTLGLVFNQVEVSDPYQYPSYLQSPYVEETVRWKWWSRRKASAAGSKR